jgi:hypothetical protein
MYEFGIRSRNPRDHHMAGLAMEHKAKGRHRRRPTASTLLDEEEQDHRWCKGHGRISGIGNGRGHASAEGGRQAGPRDPRHIGHRHRLGPGGRAQRPGGPQARLTISDSILEFKEKIPKSVLVLGRGRRWAATSRCSHPSHLAPPWAARYGILEFLPHFLPIEGRRTASKELEAPSSAAGKIRLRGSRPRSRRFEPGGKGVKVIHGTRPRGAKTLEASRSSSRRWGGAGHEEPGAGDHRHQVDKESCLGGRLHGTERTTTPGDDIPARLMAHGSAEGSWRWSSSRDGKCTHQTQPHLATYCYRVDSVGPETKGQGAGIRRQPELPVAHPQGEDTARASRMIKVVRAQEVRRGSRVHRWGRKHRSSCRGLCRAGWRPRGVGANHATRRSRSSSRWAPRAAGTRFTSD